MNLLFKVGYQYKLSNIHWLDIQLSQFLTK